MAHFERQGVDLQRTAKGIRYEKFRDALAEVLEARTAKHKTIVSAANEALGRLKSITPGAVHNDSTMASLSIQYANDEFIGERLVLPVPVSKRSDIFYKYDKRDRLAYPDDALGPRGEPNELDEHRSTGNYSVKDYGYKSFIDQTVLENQDAPLNEMVDLVESINEGIAFRRELRLASMLTTSANYGSNTAAVAGGSEWNSAGGGDPIADIQNAVKNLWNGRGQTRKVAFCSLDVYLVLSRHADIRGLFQYQKDGLASPNQIAQYFGLDELLVGAARKDTANRGQSASYSRVWSNVFGVVRVARRPSPRIAAFGFTFRSNGDPSTNQWFDPAVGKKGGFYSRVSVSEDHQVIAPDTGYLLTNVIA